MQKEEYKFPPRYYNQAVAFFTFYAEDIFASSPNSKMKGLKPAKERKCRFCQETYPKVTFRNEAHILPFALGNKYLISDFECDQCNLKFGRYESDLTKYLGISRTVSRTESRNKTPGMVSKDLRATKQEFLGCEDAIKIESSNPQQVFGFDTERNMRTVTYTKPPYKPINVFKAFLKIALCLIEENDVPKYKFAFKLLQSDAWDNKVKNLKLFGHRLPNSYSSVFASLYKKVDDKLNVHSHTMVLSFDNYMFQIFIPFNSEDMKLKQLLLPLMPPVFDGTGDTKWIDTGIIQDDLSDTSIRSDDKETMFLALEKNNFQKGKNIDMKTQQESKDAYDPAKIASLYIVPNDFKFQLQHGKEKPKIKFWALILKMYSKIKRRLKIA